MTYLDQLVVRTGKHRCRFEWPVLGERMFAAKAEVHACGTSELVVAAVAQVGADLGLLLLAEAWADERCDSKLLEGSRSRLVWLSAMVAVRLAEQIDEGADRRLGAVEEASTLCPKNEVDGEPRVLVERCDEALVGADETALSEWRLRIISMNT